MPELPEIETVKLQLHKALLGLRIDQVEVRGARTVQGDTKRLQGKAIVGVRRMAKVLIVDLEEEVCMAFHFKMTGQLIYEPGSNLPLHLSPKNTPHLHLSPNLGERDFEEEIPRRIVGGHPTEDFAGPLPSSHTRVIFKLDQGTLYFNDQRMFGWVIVGSKSEIEGMKFIQKLGPEPFGITAQEFAAIFSKLKKPIKVAIMDQEKISGVGNIYANDGCFEAKISPKRLCNSLSQAEFEALHNGVVKVLNEGILYGGATAENYVNLHGLGGHYQDHFRTYNREGLPCLRNDGGTIEKITLGGRGTFYCSVCQK